MRYFTHMALGGTLGYAASRISGVPLIYMVPAGALGAAFPDIDHPDSWISKRIPGWSGTLALIQGNDDHPGGKKNKVFAHRGVVHSLYGVFGFLILSSMFFTFILRGHYPVLIALNLGFISHLYLSDLFCDGGVHLFKLKKRVKVPIHRSWVKTGSWSEYVFLGIVISLFLLICVYPSRVDYGSALKPYFDNLPLIIIVTVVVILSTIIGYRLRARTNKSKQTTTFSIEMPRDDESTLEAGTNLFQAIHGLRAPWYRRILEPQSHLVAEIVGSKDISFHLTVPNEREVPKRIQNIFHSYYPNIRLKKEDIEFLRAEKRTAMSQLKQTRHPVFPLKSTEYEEAKDPIEAITNALSHTPAGETRMIQIVVKPTGTAWQHKARRVRNRVREKGSLNVKTTPVLWILSDLVHSLIDILSEIISPTDKADDPSKMMSTAMIPEEVKEFNEEADAKLQRACFRTEIRLIVQSDTCKYDHVEALADAFRIYDWMNRLKKNRVWPWSHYIFLTLARDRMYPLCGSRTILDAQELGSIFHPPCVTVETRGLRRTLQREKETSTYVPEYGRQIGIAVDRETERFAALGHIDERLHIAAIGRTGLGKTEEIKALIEQGLATGGGVYLDPHGEAAKQLMGQISDKYYDRVLYWAPWDESVAFGFNVLEKSCDKDPSANEINLIVGNTIDVFQSTWQMSEVMVRLKHYLRYGLQTLLEYPEPMTILELEQLYVDNDFRRKLLEKIHNPAILSFWKDQWDKLQDRQKFDHIMSLLDRLSSVSLDVRMKHTLGQNRSQIDFIDLMDSGKFLIIDLDMGKLGEDNTRLLGTLIVSKLFQASMARKRRDRIFRMYIDEAENFMTLTYAKVLSQSRKFGLCQYLFVQYLDQLPEEVLFSVLGNVGTYMCLRSGINDAKLLAPYFTRNQLPEEVNRTIEDMLNLEPYTWLVKTSADKNAIPSFKMKSLPMLGDYSEEQAEFLMDSMFNWHCRGVKTRNEIEEEINSRRNLNGTNNNGGNNKTKEPVKVAQTVKAAHRQSANDDGGATQVTEQQANDSQQDNRPRGNNGDDKGPRNEASKNRENRPKGNGKKGKHKPDGGQVQKC